MATTTGTVDGIFVDEDFAVMKLMETGTSTLRSFVIWNYLSDDDSPYYRIPHGMWLSLLRDAFASRSTVTIYYSSGSAAVGAVNLGATA